MATFVFRADASIQIGTGHVMRCITLAQAVASKGGECHFICREHNGNLFERIREWEFELHILPKPASVNFGEVTESVTDNLAYRQWLGVSQSEDAQECAKFLERLRPDWLVVDHYALDCQWERTLISKCRQLMVIDDLADRAHHCNLLLDQTFGRDKADYKGLVPTSCELLCGSDYALLRPEFAQLRSFSLSRRNHPRIQQVLISLGGVDKDNITSQVLEALRLSTLPKDCEITVVMGASAPWLVDVQRIARNLPWKSTVLVNAENIAQLMANTDLAIGGGGSTAWERCCLGVPSIVIVLADNQKTVANKLTKIGAVVSCMGMDNILIDIPQAILEVSSSVVSKLNSVTEISSKIVDGVGSARVISKMLDVQ